MGVWPESTGLYPNVVVRAAVTCRSRQWRRMKLRAAALNRGEGLRVFPVCVAVWVAGVDHRSKVVYCSVKCRRRAWIARNEVFGQASG